MRPVRLDLIALLALIACGGCRTSESQSSGEGPGETAAVRRTPSGTNADGKRGPPKLIRANGAGDLASVVRAQLAEDASKQRKLIVYVGATWCEPCQTFHKALENGNLDARLPGIDFLEFDLDRDRDRLVAAGYQSHYIPLFVKPGPDGRATPRFIEGSIKGDGAAEEILPRLAPLLD